MKWNSPQTVSAMICLLSGILLCYIAYFTSENKDVPEGVLWYMGQMLVYAGGIFGLKLYADGKLVKMKRDITEELKHGEAIFEVEQGTEGKA